MKQNEFRMRTWNRVRRWLLVGGVAVWAFAGRAEARPQEAREPDGAFEARPQQAEYKGGGAPHHEEIRSMKIAFFSDMLQLTPQESEKFWPIYNEYWKARREIGWRRRELHRVIREGRAGEAQFRELLAVMDAERGVTAEYIAKFRQVLPVEKAAKVFVADEDFKNFLIRKAAGGR